MLDREPGDRQGADRCGRARRELDEVGAEPAGRPGGAGKQDLHRRHHPLASARRPGDDERALAPAELAVEDEEGHAAEVVTVEVREEDAVDRGGIDAGALQGDERRGAAVDQDAAAGTVEAETGLEAPAAAEGVAGAEEAKPETRRRAVGHRRSSPRLAGRARMRRAREAVRTG
jgi:hypothetical protein